MLGREWTGRAYLAPVCLEVHIAGWVVEGVRSVEVEGMVTRFLLLHGRTKNDEQVLQ